MEVKNILLWILFLDIVALILISFRIDADAHYNSMLELLFDNGILGFILGLVIIYTMLPLTLIGNIFKLFK